MTVYKNHLLCNIIKKKKACSELFGVITVSFEYTEHKLKLFVSFDKNKPLYCLFY